MQEEGFAFASFHHPKNIRVGRARILWAPSVISTSGLHHPEGWVLPGGARTRDEARARAAAVTVDALSGALS